MLNSERAILVRKNMIMFSKLKKVRTIPLQYLLFGMVIGSIIGLCLIMPAEYSSSLLKFTRRENQDFFKEVISHDDAHHNNMTINATLANQLYKEVKILCLILTSPKTHKSKAIHIKATWGKRCNYLLFMSTKEDPSLPSVALPNLIENRDNLWGKTKASFKYVYENYYDKADWFFKADDDTFAIIENMRYMLHYHNSSDPSYFGFRFKRYVKQGYMSGGSGYVLSKEALRRFIEQAMPDGTKCKKSNIGNEDLEMGKCLEAVGVEAGDSRDKLGRSTFMPIFVNGLFIPGSISKGFWFWGYTFYPVKEGMDCCSDYPISFHYVVPENLYLFEYLIYHVKTFGLSYNSYDTNNTFGAVISTTVKTTSASVEIIKYITSGISNKSSWDDYHEAKE